MASVDVLVLYSEYFRAYCAELLSADDQQALAHSCAWFFRNRSFLRLTGAPWRPLHRLLDNQDSAVTSLEMDTHKLITLANRPADTQQVRSLVLHSQRPTAHLWKFPEVHVFSAAFPRLTALTLAGESALVPDNVSVSNLVAAIDQDQLLHLVTLRLTVPYTKRVMHAVSKLRKLETLELPFVWPDEAFMGLTFPNIKTISLTHIHIGNWNWYHSDAHVIAVHHLISRCSTTLQRLSLRGSPFIINRLFYRLQHCGAKFPCLGELCIEARTPRVSGVGTGVHIGTNSPVFPGLRVLRVCRRTAVEYLPLHKRLQELHIEGETTSYITERLTTGLLRSLVYLRRLTLDDSGTPTNASLDRIVEALATYTYPDLWYLKLGGNTFSPKFGDHLTTILLRNKITVLDIRQHDCARDLVKAVQKGSVLRTVYLPRANDELARCGVRVLI
jgi:hypothetical protein